ncbi:MAG: tetratricopeptide repeat protein, partial [Candidatus Poribacteria bacterium]
IEISADNFTVYCNLGNIYKEQGKFEEAIKSYQQALSIQPNIAEVHSNMGQILEKSRMPNEAISAYQKALDINPEHAEIRRNLSVPLLTLGSFKRGWKEYEWRWKCDRFVKKNKKDFPQPLWENSPLSGKSIAIWLEQGVGDCIMFASILGKLQQQAKQILVETEYRLLPIFQRSFPGIDFFLAQNPSHLQLLDSSIDFQSPIGSLAQWLLPNEESFPKYCHYLVACPHRTQKLRHKLQQQADGKLLIGISWKSANKDIGELKSTSLIQWEDLLSQKDCFFINLQYGDVEEEIDAFTDDTKISIYQDKEIDSLQSLDDFASQIAALDLIISTSNTTVHMAGALGRPVWTLLHYAPDWRWQLDRSDTPWYPSMTLYRQLSSGDWYSVFQQVQPNLKQFVEQNLKTQKEAYA